jgi:hypothetical protein
MAYVKRLQDYALRGGTGKGIVTSNRLVQGPTGRLVSVDRKGNIASGRVSGTGDIGYKLKSGKRVGNPWKGAQKKYISSLDKARKGLEARWAAAATKEAGRDKMALDGYNAVMKTMPKDLMPEEQAQWMQQPHVQSAIRNLKGRMERSMRQQQGASPREYTKAYGLRVGGNIDPRFSPRSEVKETAQGTVTKRPEIVKKRLRSTGAAVELRGRTKDGRLVVQDLNTMKPIIVTPEELEGMDEGYQQGWQAPTGT